MPVRKGFFYPQKGNFLISKITILEQNNYKIVSFLKFANKIGNSHFVTIYCLFKRK